MRAGSLKNWLIIGGALTLTAGFAWSDLASTRQLQQDAASRWAHQVASQAEGMFLSARQEGEKDPVGWAVSFLSQGIEPRVMRITKLSRDSGAPAEEERYDPETRTLHYVKVLNTEDGAGIDVEVTHDYLGFLGTHSRLASDALCALMFAFWAGGFWLALRIRTERRARRPALRGIIIEWIGQTRKLLVQLGTHVREMVRAANLITQAAAASRHQLVSLRERIHEGVREMREARRIMREGDQALIQAEVLALNMTIEAAKLGSQEAEKVAEMAERLHRMVQKASRVQSRNSQALQKLEAELEPIATDADLAFNAYDKVFQASKDMDGHIKRTSETLVGQAKLVQDVNSKLA